MSPDASNTAEPESTALSSGPWSRLAWRLQLVLATTVLALTACAEPETPAVATRPALPHGTGPVAVLVNGQPIYEAEVREAVSQMIALGESGRLQREREGVEEAVGPGHERALCEDMLISFVYDELMRQEAARRGLAVRDTQLDQAIATEESALDSPAKVAEATAIAALLQEESRLSPEAFEAARRERLRTGVIRRAVNGLLVQELETDDRAVVDRYWEELWRRSEISSTTAACQRLYGVDAPSSEPEGAKPMQRRTGSGG